MKEEEEEEEGDPHQLLGLWYQLESQVSALCDVRWSSANSCEEGVTQHLCMQSGGGRSESHLLLLDSRN